MGEYRVVQFIWFIHLTASTGFLQVSHLSAESTSGTIYRSPCTYSTPLVISTGWGALSLWKNISEHLDRVFPSRWIGRGGSASWLHRFPDLSPLDFFLWDVMKSLVKGTPFNSEMDLVAEIYYIAVVRSVKCLVFLNMSANPCCVNVVCAYMAVVTISDTSCEVYLFI